MESKEYILIGEIVAAMGIRGEVKVKSFSDDPSRFGELNRVYISRTENDSPENQPEYSIERARTQNNMAVLKFSGVEDRNAAESLRGSFIYISHEQLRDLPDDTYYLRDLIGLKVYEFASSENTDVNAGAEPIGKIKDVLQTGPQDIYVIEVSSVDVLVPAVKEFIKSVHIDKNNPEEGYIVIKFIEGMLPKKKNED